MRNLFLALFAILFAGLHALPHAEAMEMKGSSFAALSDVHSGAEIAQVVSFGQVECCGQNEEKLENSAAHCVAECVVALPSFTVFDAETHSSYEIWPSTPYRTRAAMALLRPPITI